MLGALLALSATLTAMAAQSVASVSNGSLVVSPAARDAAYGPATNAVWSAPDGAGPLTLADPGRILATADRLAASGSLAAFDRTQALAFSRLFMIATTAYYRGQTSALSAAGQLLWNGLYSSPTPISKLAEASSAVVREAAAAAQPTAAVDAIRGALVTNFATLGVTVDPTTTGPSGPVAVKEGVVTIDATFANACYHAASLAVNDPEPRPTVADPDAISARAASRSIGMLAEPLLATSCVRLEAVALAAWNGRTEALRATGEALFDLLQAGSHPLATYVAAITSLQTASVDDGHLASDAVARKLHDLLVTSLTGIGVDASRVPLPGPVPDWTKFAAVKNGLLTIDEVAQSRLYHLAVEACTQPQATRIGDADGMSRRVNEVLAASTVDDEYNAGQSEAFTRLLATTCGAYWWGSTEALRDAGEAAFDTLISSHPVAIQDVKSVWRNLYRQAIMDRQYETWPAAEKTADLIDSRLPLLGADVRVASLTELFGLHPEAANGKLPGTDFAVAQVTGGQVANASARLVVPDRCLAAPALISVTTLGSSPVWADHSIHDPVDWSTCRPTVSIRAAEGDRHTFAGWVSKDGRDISDYAAATTSDGWVSVTVDHLTAHEDAEPGLLDRIGYYAGSIVNVRSPAPDCSRVGGSSEWMSVSAPAWRSCSGVRDGVGRFAARWNRGYCGVLTTNRAVTLSHPDSFIADGMDGNDSRMIICPGSLVQADIPANQTLGMSVAPNIGMSLAFHGIEVVTSGLEAFGGGAFATSQQFVAAMLGCVLGSVAQPLYGGGPSVSDMADILEHCVASADKLGKLGNIKIDMNNGGRAKRWLGKAARWAMAAGKALGRGVVSVAIAEQVIDDINWTDSRVTVRYAPPPPVTQPASPALVDGRIYVDGGIGILHGTVDPGSTSGTMYFTYDSSGVARGMNLSRADDRAVYVCLARRFQARMAVPAGVWLNYHRQESIYPATCDSTRPVKPVTAGTINFILREASGSSWFLDAGRQRHKIATGAVFNCLAQRYFVRDQTPLNEIQQFAVAGDATC